MGDLTDRSDLPERSEPADVPERSEPADVPEQSEPTARPDRSALTHLDERGHARMVDVSAKDVTTRVAVASAFVRTGSSVRARIADGDVPKGDVLAVARIAGIMAAKRTADLVPLCHPLPLDAVAVELKLAPDGVGIETRVTTTGRTGVEMEALTAASVAALTVYDMCKALERGIVIEHVRLEEKSGGKSGRYVRSPSRSAPRVGEDARVPTGPRQDENP